MSKNQPDLKALTQEWYQKLKDSGFEDIEDPSGEYLNQWHSFYFKKRHAAGRFGGHQEYYYRATQFLLTHKFESSIEKEVWRLHSDGTPLREIAACLQAKQVKLYKDGAQKIIKRLASLMLSGVEFEKGTGGDSFAPRWEP